MVDKMEKHEVKIRENDEYIKLGQVLKLVGAVSSGVEAKIVITEGEVKVNGEIDTRRGRKLYPKDEVSFEDYEIVIK